MVCLRGDEGGKRWAGAGDSSRGIGMGRGVSCEGVGGCSGGMDSRLLGNDGVKGGDDGGEGVPLAPAPIDHPLP